MNCDATSAQGPKQKPGRVTPPPQKPGGGVPRNTKSKPSAPGPVAIFGETHTPLLLYMTPQREQAGAIGAILKEGTGPGMYAA